jgi:hypothetical protein
MAMAIGENPTSGSIVLHVTVEFCFTLKIFIRKENSNLSQATTKLGVARPNPTINAVHSSVADFKVTSLCIRYIVAVNNAIM